MVTIPRKRGLRRSLKENQDSIILNFISKITSRISPYWLACIPLTAIIVAVWDGAAMAQGYDGPEDLEQVKIVLDTVFLLFCSVLVIFMNAGFAMLETGFCRQKKRC